MLVLTLLLEQQQGILTKAAGISIVFQNVIYKNSNTMSFLLHNIVKSVKQVCLNAFKQEGDKSFCYGSGTYICVNGHNYIVLALLRTKKHFCFIHLKGFTMRKLATCGSQHLICSYNSSIPSFDI